MTKGLLLCPTTSPMTSTIATLTFIWATLSKAMATEQLPTSTMSPSPTDATKPSTDSYGHVADMKYTDEVKYPEYNHYNAAPDYKTHSYSAPSY